MFIYLSLLICILGGILYVFGDKFPKLVELGRIMFFAGLFVFLLNRK